MPGWTSISAAIDYSVRLIGTSGLTAQRRVIDVSGDGSNNDGREVTAARDDAVAAGVTVNGLPIVEVEPELDDYYRRNVSAARVLSWWWRAISTLSPRRCCASCWWRSWLVHLSRLWERSRRVSGEGEGAANSTVRLAGTLTLVASRLDLSPRGRGVLYTLRAERGADFLGEVRPAIRLRISRFCQSGAPARPCMPA